MARIIGVLGNLLQQVKCTFTANHAEKKEQTHIPRGEEQQKAHIQNQNGLKSLNNIVIVLFVNAHGKLSLLGQTVGINMFGLKITLSHL